MPIRSTDLIQGSPSSHQLIEDFRNHAVEMLGRPEDTLRLLRATVPPHLLRHYDLAWSVAGIEADYAASSLEVSLTAVAWFVNQIAPDASRSTRAAIHNLAQKRASGIIQHIQALEAAERASEAERQAEREAAGRARMYTCPVCNQYDPDASEGHVYMRVVGDSGAYGSGRRFESCFRCFRVAEAVITRLDADTHVLKGQTRAEVVAAHLALLPA